jgi:hypothetical protein
MIRTTLSIIGTLVCLAGLSLGIVHLWNAGWLDRLTPQPRFAEAVSIALHGPKETLVGGEYYFHVEVTGGSGRPVCNLVPSEPAALTEFPDGRTFRFQSSVPGIRVLTVSVAGDGRQVASDSIEFENLEVFEETMQEESAPAQPPIDIESFKALLAPPQPQTLSITAIVLDSLAHVDTANKVEEAHRIAGIIKSLITRIQTGLVAPDADVALELESQIELALGEHARPWSLFVSDVRTTIFRDLRAQGVITTAASAVPTLTEIAAALSSVQ